MKTKLPTIGVMAPSSYVERADIEASKRLLESLGFTVFVHPQTFERHHQSAGTDLQKALAFQGLWQRPDIDVIWAAGGGNRALHLLESINFERIKTNPKTLVGFSDVTALLNTVYAEAGHVGIHGPVFKSLHKMNRAQLNFALKLLKGEKPAYPMGKAKVFRVGAAEGPLVGGNLSVFQYLPGTLKGEWYKNAILFLEDAGDEWSRIDRMLAHLRRTGVFNEISGLILGQFSNMKDTGRPYGFLLTDMIAEHTAGRDIPIVMNAPFGHGSTLYALPVGGPARLTADEDGAVKLEIL